MIQKNPDSGMIKKIIATSSKISFSYNRKKAISASVAKKRTIMKKLPSAFVLSASLAFSLYLHGEEEPLIDSAIANEAIEEPEAEKEQAVVLDLEENENIDIDTLILEAENSLKEENNDEAISQQNGKPQVYIRYDEEDKLFLSGNPFSPPVTLEEAKPNLEVSARIVPQSSQPNSVAIEIPSYESNLDIPEITFQEVPFQSLPQTEPKNPSKEEVADFEISPQFNEKSETAFEPPLISIERKEIPLPIEPHSFDLSSSEVSIAKEPSLIPLPEASTRAVIETSPALGPKRSIDIQKLFSEAPLIYTLLMFFSISTLALTFYQWIYFRRAHLMPHDVLSDLRLRLQEKEYLEVRAFCLKQDSFFFKMIASGITAKEHSLPEMIEAMKMEGKIQTSAILHKLSILKYVAIIAPLLGLLGTVWNVFSSFSSSNAADATLGNFFRSLNPSLGTTLAGISVSILALALHALAKYRFQLLVQEAELESERMARLIKASSQVQQ